MTEVVVTESEAYAALEAASGNVSAAARQLGVSRTALKSRIDKSPRCLMLLQDRREAICDTAEDNVFDAVSNGDQKMSKFVLMTIGKNRGYVSRVESTGADGQSHSAGMAEEVGRALDRIADRIVTPGATTGDPV